jgi:L,D-peptidoglycan transpeptidase YkuD (ErfK/YbiS/YcfS/YnhG family)
MQLALCNTRPTAAGSPHRHAPPCFHQYDEKEWLVHSLKTFVVRARSAGSSRGTTLVAGVPLPSGLGRCGRRARKREGDGATPIGTWALVEVLYRADRIGRPRTALPIRALRPDDGWCDASGDRNYNRAVRHPYPASAERLWRQDHVYDLIVVLSHNRLPRVQGMGSAVFIHLARIGYSPTEGCIALSEPDLRRLLANAGRRTRLVVSA